MRVVTVVGARPQFIKAAPVCRALRLRHEELLVHTGQHYDPSMSRVFFDELGIPAPDVDLGVGSGSHGAQTGRMLAALDELLDIEQPDLMLVYGDTNSTLAGALAAAKLHVPVAHIEAGLRSFDRSMPEEVNRVLVDHMSDILFCPTVCAIDNLAAEGVTRGVHQVGDVMLDTMRMFSESVDPRPVLDRHGVEQGGYYLATVHRAATSDSSERLSSVVRAFSRLDRPVVWSVHPRTRHNLERFGLWDDVVSSSSIVAVDPLSYTETSALLRGAHALLTDSGGMQKEAYFVGVPCVTLRDSTEWIETIELGWNRLTVIDEDAIVAAAGSVTLPDSRPEIYGDGRSAESIVAILEQAFTA